MLGWVARALSGPGAADRGARPRAGEPRLRPSARRRPIKPRGVRGRCHARQAPAGGHRRRSGARLPGPELFHRPGQSVGAGMPRRRRLPLQLEHLSDSRTITTACPTRRASRSIPPRGAGCSSCRATTVRLFNRNLPAGGGGYFRLLPYGVSRWCLNRVNTVDRQPCIFYFHPWEIDPGQPRQRGASLKTPLPALRQSLRDGAAACARCLRDFAWDRMDRLFLEAAREPARA